MLFQFKNILQFGVLASFLLLSCKAKMLQEKPSNQMSTSNTLHCSITSSNLTEDANAISSGNDELFLLIVEEFGESLKEIYVAEFLMDATQKSYDFDIKYDAQEKAIWYVVLIELDNTINSESYKQRIIEEFATFKQSAQNKSDRGLKSIIGDDDVIAVFDLEPSKIDQEETKQFNGIHIYDFYNYAFTFIRQQ